MAYIFQLIAHVVSVYTMLCFIRIIITWLPGVNYSGFGRFLSAVCDPYLNLFSRLRLRIGNLDFSPAVAIGVLTAASTILDNILRTGRLYIGGIIALLVSMIWSLFSTLLGFLLILLLIRLIVLLVKGSEDYYGSMWAQFDNALNPIVFRISGAFMNGRPVSYRNALILSIVTLVVLIVGGNLLVRVLIGFIAMLPF